MTKIKTLAITALGSMLIWNAAAQNLIVNGGFEDPNLGTGSTSYGPGVSTLTGWTIGGDGIQFFPANVCGVTGSQCVQMTLNYGAPAILSQTIPTTPGAYYTMRVGVAERTGTAVNGTARFGDTVQPFSFPGGTSYTNVTFVAAATSSSTTVEIDGGDPLGSSMLLIIDDVSVVQAVPGPVDANASSVSASQQSVAADGLTTSTITVRLSDTNGIPVSGKTVSLANTSGPGSPVITAVSATTDGGGRAYFTVSSTTAGTNVFTATDVTDSNLLIAQTATVYFLSGSVANSGTSTVVASPGSVVANGVVTSTVTVTLKNASNGTVAGKAVSLAKSSGPGTPTITTISGTSGVNGVATFTVASPNAGVCVFTVTDVTDGIVLSNTATVTFTVGPLSQTTSTVIASPTFVPADNSSASIVTITLRDATSNGIPNKTVTLTQTSGPGSPSITPVAGATTDTNGVIAFSISSVTPGTYVFTATDVDAGNIVLSNTATVTFVGLISWSGFATTVADDSDVVTNGTLQYAEHWAGVDGTVNGVFFSAAQNHVIGSSGGYETLNASGYPQGTLSTNYWNILRGKWYNAGAGQIVTLNSLNVGDQYLVQIWSSDPRYSSTQMEIIIPGFALGIKAGQYGVGTFTAGATVQVLALGGDGILNAVQVRDLSSTTTLPPTPVVRGITGPVAGSFTIQGTADVPENIVTLEATNLTPPVAWIKIQTNAVPAGPFSITVSQGAKAIGFFRLMGQ